MSSTGQMDANNAPVFSGSASENPVNGTAYSTALSQSGFAHDNAHPRTLYVGNLDPAINDDFIHTLFSPFGRISGLKLINDNLSDPYCFIEYEDHAGAANAILTMNKRVCLEREIKVNWATSPGCTGPKQDTSRHFHIFVGDLSPEIETQQLRDAFSPFGEISDCRVVRDSHTLKSKGYGFVSFIKRQDAESAIANMNGQWLGSRAIRTNWASRKPPAQQQQQQQLKNDIQIGPTISSNNRQLNFEEVYGQTSPTNCTVYCGGISNGLSDELLQKTFTRFGPIQEIRVFKDKGYAFIKFPSKEMAANAIVMMNNQEVFGQTMKCSWGKETIDSTLAAQAQLAQSLASPSLIYPYGQQLSYWYPNSYPGQPYPVQGIQYPYNQFTFAPAAQSNQTTAPFNSTSIGMSLNPSWQGPGNNAMQNVNVQSSPLLPSAIHQSQMQQSSILTPYPMQGYQAQ